MRETLRILLIEDNPADADLLIEMLSEVEVQDALSPHFAITHVKMLADGLAFLAAHPVDVILLDLFLPDSRGQETFERVYARAPQWPIIMLTGLDDQSLAARIMRAGAQDYLIKHQFDGHLLARAIQYAIERKRAGESLRRYADEQAALYAITAAAATLLDPQDLLTTALDVTLSVLQSNAGWVLLPGDAPSDLPRMVAWRGVPLSFVQEQVVLALGIEMASSQSGVQCLRLPPSLADQVRVNDYVCIPLRAAGHVLGMMDLAWPRAESLSDADRKLLDTIGQQVGMALRNAQLYQAARQVNQLRILNELDRELATTLVPEQVAEIALRHMTDALKPSLGMLILLYARQESGLTPTLTTSQGWLDLAVSPQDMDDLQLVTRSANRHQTIWLSSDEMCEWGECPRFVQSWGAAGLLAPMWSETELAAVMLIWRQHNSLPFADPERSLAQAIAGRVSQAVQNARLYRASQERSERLAMLNAIGTAAVSSLDSKTVLHQILELTCQALDAQGGFLLLYNPESQKLVVSQSLLHESDVSFEQTALSSDDVANRVMSQRQILVLNEIDYQDARFSFDLREKMHLGIESLIGAPLIHHDQVVGVIQAINKRRGGFTFEDRRMLEAVSFTVAAVIVNTRLYAALYAYTEELATLYRIGRALTSELDYARVVQDALLQIKELFHADDVSLLQPDPHTGALYFVRSLNESLPADGSLSLELGEGIAGWVAAHGEPVLAADASTDARFSARIDRQISFQTRALMAVPLSTPERQVGVIEVVSSEVGVYQSKDLNMLQTLASTLTIALENARLYRELKQSLREREETQAQLIQTEKMVALGRLVASIAHEINNPLQAMRGCLTLTREELAGRLRHEKLYHYLDILEEEVERMSAIVRRTREFYRPTRQGVRATDLHAVLGSVLDLIDKQLQEREITLERDWDLGLPEVELNADQFKQVFLNLALNAADAMPDGGVLRIATAMDQMRGRDDPTWLPAVRITFQDSGVGMPPETLSRIFEPFFTTKENGSGLGLYISYTIVEAHHGQISIQSEVGQGSICTILLPLAQRQASG